MADDIVKRLVQWAKLLYDADVANNWPLVLEAADEIERLCSEVNNLRLQIVALSITKEARRG